MSNALPVIAAVATGAPGGIGVIRISGEDAFSVAEKVFFPCSKSKNLSTAHGFTSLFGEVRELNGNKIDDCIAAVFRAPHSFTGENTVELSVHGGAFVMARTLAALIGAGATQAQGGEFTKRAFLNGKMDLTAASAVMETVSAQGRMQLLAASARRDGALYRRISDIRNRLLTLASHIAAWTDFPEEDVENVDGDGILEILTAARDATQRLIDTADAGIAITSGVRTAIVGKPNVGKSTLLNLLARRRRSIVTDIPGTTRDTVEATINVGGISLLAVDTAGIRTTHDEVEKLGVELSYEEIDKAQLVLVVFDGSSELASSDREIMKITADKTAVAIINKADRGVIPATEEAIRQTYPTAVTLSAIDEASRELITDAVFATLKLNTVEAEGGLIGNSRELNCAGLAAHSLEEAILAQLHHMPPDIVGICIEDAITALGELTGESTADSIIDGVFANFCVGK